MCVCVPHPGVSGHGVSGLKLQLFGVPLAEQDQTHGAGRLDILQGRHLERVGVSREGVPLVLIGAFRNDRRGLYSNGDINDSDTDSNSWGKLNNDMAIDDTKAYQHSYHHRHYCRPQHQHRRRR